MGHDASQQTRENVRRKYAERAGRVGRGGVARASGCDAVTSDLYTQQEGSALPEEALKASLGCGNPTALASLAPGEVVLDLGSGGGIDVLLAAQRVAPTGFVYGLDMTDEMLGLAEENRANQGATNVSFLKGYMEEIPLPDGAVDVIISNCVINLSANKKRVLEEAFRVLKPGGRFAVSDIVVQGDLPADIRSEMEARVGCVAGALEEGEYRRLLAATGFRDISLEVTREHDWAQPGGGVGCPLEATAAGGRVVSAFVRARKPPQA